jgi:serine/threonine protein kinase
LVLIGYYFVLLKKAWEIFAQLVLILEALDFMDVVHRNIKIENIFWNDCYNNIVLGNFGHKLLINSKKTPTDTTA